ncbi:uncharacterized protein LOC133931095 [Phragmites australis]|uniref:uncharacterized protein LOC133931095 n=1 Tax=Phragmites australis TaxID=29695 RepID=UPI002D7967CE|nr:uncharacterized protein LOC133931095 [Phragmites australis]
MGIDPGAARRWSSALASRKIRVLVESAQEGPVQRRNEWTRRICLAVAASGRAHRGIYNGSEAEWLAGGHSSAWIPEGRKGVLASRERRGPEAAGGMSAPAQAMLALALAAILSTPPPQPETFSNIPPTLSGGDRKQERIKHPRSAKALQCTTKCVGTCIRGGAGEGPLNMRRPLVVFKDGFRSRQYCLTECSDICNRIKDGQDGP